MQLFDMVLHSLAVRKSGLEYKSDAVMGLTSAYKGHRQLCQISNISSGFSVFDVLQVRSSDLKCICMTFLVPWVLPLGFLALHL